MLHKFWHFSVVMLGLYPSGIYADIAHDETAIYDIENAQDINELCAGCHGRKGQGGKGGIYPRLAGLTPEYMTRQIEAFKSRERINLPMLPYANDRELSQQDVHDITHYLSEISLPTQLPPSSEVIDGLERLRQSKSIVQIGRYPGDINQGERIYMEACRICHSRTGFGRTDKPRLRGQHTQYLKKQMLDFKKGTRQHIDWEVKFADLSDNDINNILAFLSILDD